MQQRRTCDCKKVLCACGVCRTQRTVLKCVRLREIPVRAKRAYACKWGSPRAMQKHVWLLSVRELTKFNKKAVDRAQQSVKLSNK